MTQEQLASEIALGLVATGVEGGFDAVTCSTAGDYPSLGCSQWEGDRADDLLNRISGGEYFMCRSYSSIEDAGELQALMAMLDSAEGRQAQLDKLAEDALDYVQALQEVESLDDSRCLIYCGMWCPTSTTIVRNFCQRHQDEGYNLRCLWVLRDLFRDEYADAAGCSEYASGYANRANTTYDYVAGLDLSGYGE